jgi:hypothetical protein
MRRKSKTEDAGQRLICRKDHAKTKTSKHDRKAKGPDPVPWSTFMGQPVTRLGSFQAGRKAREARHW